MKEWSGKRKRNQEEQVPEEQDFDMEGLEPASLWLRVFFILGLIVLIVLLSAGIWYLTHPDKQDEGGNNSSIAAGQTSETIPESDRGQTFDPNGEEPAEPSAGQATEEDPEASPEPGDESGEESREEMPKQEEVDAGRMPWEETPGDGPMSFAQVYESVTPRDMVNLRSAPTTMDDGNIVVQVWNGEVLLRTGINEDKGWSEIEYDDQILYAVNSYLTTDLDFITPVNPSDPNWVRTQDGRVIIFTDCDDWISPKEYVNLRTEPSTSEGDATVRLQLNYGEGAHRTGYSADSGWSRVEINGEVLYVVSSLVYVATEQ